MNYKKMPLPRPLLQDLSIEDQKKASLLSEEVCEKIAKFAGLKIDFRGPENPGEKLLKWLDRSGCTFEDYKYYMNSVDIQTIYSPQAKVAILISNDQYEYLTNLVTPPTDCEALGQILRNLGFITICVKNTPSALFKNIIMKTIALIPEDSYCFLFYAGHGCELINTKCILSTDCPAEGIVFNHCTTENWLLREAAKCKPELCVLIMDMCRINLDRQSNPQIYTALPEIEEYSVHSNLLISYATSSAAYEYVYIEKEETIGALSYCLNSTDVVRAGASQYVNVLCSKLTEYYDDISTILDKVHADVEMSVKNQKPIKVQCGVSKRFLHDPQKGDINKLLSIFKEALQQYRDFCIVL